MPSHGAKTTNSSDNLPFRRYQERENDQNADKWSKAQLNRGGRAAAAAHGIALGAPSTPSFAIHQDEQLPQPTATPNKPTPKATGVLKKIREADQQQQADVPVALFEPYDPTKKVKIQSRLFH